MKWKLRSLPVKTFFVFLSYKMVFSQQTFFSTILSTMLIIIQELTGGTSSSRKRKVTAEAKWTWIKIDHQKDMKKMKHRNSIKDLLEWRGAIKVIWAGRNFYRNSHLLVNDLIMKIKHETEVDGTLMLASLHFISFLCCFYYSKSSKSYFVDAIFTYFRRLPWEEAKGGTNMTLFSISSYHKRQKTFLASYEETVQNHKVDEWSSIIHTWRKPHKFTFYRDEFSSSDVSLREWKIGRGEMLNEKNSWYDFPLSTRSNDFKHVEDNSSATDCL